MSANCVYRDDQTFTRPIIIRIHSVHTVQSQNDSQSEYHRVSRDTKRLYALCSVFGTTYIEISNCLRVL